MVHDSQCDEFNRTTRHHQCVCNPFRLKYDKVRKGLADEVNHPSHYTTHPSGVECIDIAEQMTFNLGNALKYIWRCGLKSSDREKDLKKAAWYVNREIERLRKLNGQDNQPEKHGAAPSTTIHGVGEAPGELAARYHSGG